MASDKFSLKALQRATVRGGTPRGMGQRPMSTRPPGSVPRASSSKAAMVRPGRMPRGAAFTNDVLSPRHGKHVFGAFDYVSKSPSLHFLKYDEDYSAMEAR